MNPNFTFDAEGVFDQPIKPLRIRKRKQRHKKNQQWIPMTDGAVLDAHPIVTDNHLLSTQAFNEARRTLKMRTTGYRGKREIDPKTDTLPWQYHHQLFMVEQANQPEPAPCRSVLGQVDPPIDLAQVEQIEAIMLKGFDADERRSGFGNRRQDLPLGEPCGVICRFDDESNVITIWPLLSGSKEDRRKRERRIPRSDFGFVNSEFNLPEKQVYKGAKRPPHANFDLDRRK
jgi:hypothetical protein